MLSTIYILVFYPVLILFYLKRIKDKNFKDFKTLSVSVFISTLILIMIVVQKIMEIWVSLKNGKLDKSQISRREVYL